MHSFSNVFVNSIGWMCFRRKLAVVTISRIIYLFDETGMLKEKFPTKPADPKVGNYLLFQKSTS